MQEEVIIDIILLKKFFNRECSKEEKKIVINWFVDSTYEQKLGFVLKKHWDEIEYDRTELDTAAEKVLNKIHHQINLEKFDQQQKEPWLKKAYIHYSKIAAVLLVPIFLYAVYQYNDQNGFLDKNPTGYTATAVAKIVSPLGARTHFVLPDGSSGWLNSGSTLEFSTKFTGKQRNLKLIGEAWFDVVTDPDMPFVVNTSGIEVVAVGTKFNVQSYANDDVVNVTLESGKVLVNRVKNRRIELLAALEPGDQVSILKTGYKLQKEIQEVETINYTSWKQGKLIIRNDNMGEVVRKLERWYNVKIEIKDREIEDYVYRATFNDEMIDEILNFFKLTSPIDYRIKKREILGDGTVKQKEIELFLKK